LQINDDAKPQLKLPQPLTMAAVAIFIYNPNDVIRFVMSIAIARKSGCLDILA
jgi:hypothetical protein